jgi:hypothetical protein
MGHLRTVAGGGIQDGRQRSRLEVVKGVKVGALRDCGTREEA